MSCACLASQVMKPLVSGAGDAHLNATAQEAVAAWAFKTVLVNDIPITGGNSKLLPCAAGFASSLKPPSLIEVWAGPPALVMADGFRLYGVTPHYGEVQLGTGRNTQTIKAEFWRLSLGYGDLIVRPLLQWLPLPDPDGWVRIFPSLASLVTLSPSNDAEPRISWSGLPPGMTCDNG